MEASVAGGSGRTRAMDERQRATQAAMVAAFIGVQHGAGGAAMDNGDRVVQRQAARAMDGSDRMMDGRCWRWRRPNDASESSR
ncbi:hypothetical protein ACLOJK_004701 [Asimina triloba]